MLNRLPVIVGFGGYNAAGRTSFHHGYRRTVLNSLDEKKRANTIICLATMMKLVEYRGGKYFDREQTPLSGAEVVKKFQITIEQNTLIRRINAEQFNADKVPSIRDIELSSVDDSSFIVKRRDLPSPLPSNWKLETIDDRAVRITISGNVSIKMETFREFDVQSAGILPTGFIPSEHYNARFHPKGLQLTVLGASDAINSMGIDWKTVVESVSPDEIAVYAASGLGQTDEYGSTGYMQARLRSGRPSSKQMPLSLNSMPADFINAYLLGSIGTTGAMAGACATFLYNLRLAVDDIVSGRHRVVVCGSGEAPVTPEVMEGFAGVSFRFVSISAYQ